MSRRGKLHGRCRRHGAREQQQHHRHRVFKRSLRVPRAHRWRTAARKRANTEGQLRRTATCLRLGFEHGVRRQPFCYSVSPNTAATSQSNAPAILQGADITVVRSSGTAVVAFWRSGNATVASSTGVRGPVILASSAAGVAIVERVPASTHSSGCRWRTRQGRCTSTTA